MEDRTRLVPVVVQEGKPPVWIELSHDGPEPETSGTWVLAAADVDGAQVPRSMNEAIARIQPLVAMLFEKLAAVSTPPKEIEVNLGLKLSGKVGIFVAESTGEATFAVKLKWSK